MSPGVRVVCAAMRNKNGYVLCSPRHWDRIADDTVARSEEYWEDAVQGFVDERGNFLTREEAWIVAEKAGQIIRRVGGDGTKLFSENLY